MRRYYLTYRYETYGPLDTFEQMMEWLRLLIQIDEQNGLPISRDVRFRVEEAEAEGDECSDS